MNDWKGYRDLVNNAKALKVISDSIKHYKENLAVIADDKKHKDLPEVVKTILIETAEKGVNPIDKILIWLDSDDIDELSKLGNSVDFLNVALDLYETDLLNVQSIMKKNRAELLNVTEDIDETLSEISKAREIIKPAS